MTSPPAKRVRTGCLKCRVRRRKCDEGKPKCQRCVAGGFDCKYGTRLSFLQKNAFTIEEPVNPAKTSAPGSSYRKVQFMDETTKKPPARNREREPQIDASEATSTQPHPEIQPLNTDVPRSLVSSLRNSDAPHEDGSCNEELHPSSALLAGLSPPPICSPAASGGDQIVLDALLSLGSDHTTVFVDSNLQRHAIAPATPQATSSLAFLDHDSPTVQESPVQNVQADLVLSDVGTPDEVAFGLLKHYRYEVAPWLDICDLSQTFGIAVPCFATDSNIVLDRLQALSLLSSNARLTLAGGPNSSQTHVDSSLNNPASTEEELLCSSLEKAGDVFRGIDLASCQASHSILSFTDRFPSLDLVSPLSIASYYLMLRLEMSKALISETPMPCPIIMPEISPSHWRRTESAQQVFISAHIPLLLGVRTINFCWGESPDRLAATSDDIVKTWRAMVDELNSWYTRRRQEFLSVVEIDNSTDDEFPTILFTSGAAVFSNQLYHTAMFLLLRHKPRTVMLPSRHRSSMMSVLWHARRVCGIALNNDRHECWDFCLVASLLVAARTMTHETQHQALLDGLERVRILTGWCLGSIRDQLLSEWAL